jgi:hypothetical protein
MAPKSSIENKKDNINEVVSTDAGNTAKAEVLATSLHGEKNMETDVAIDQTKQKVSLL